MVLVFMQINAQKNEEAERKSMITTTRSTTAIPIAKIWGVTRLLSLREASKLESVVAHCECSRARG